MPIIPRTLSGLAALAFFAAPVSAQDSSEALDGKAKATIADYRALSAARAIDDRCMALDYAPRRLLDNVLIGTMLDLPGIAGTSSAGMGTKAYYANMSEISEKYGKPVREKVAQIPCEQADQALAEARLFLTADILAHFERAGDAFDEKASESEKRMFGQLVRSVRSSLAQAPEGTLERYVRARMQTIEEEGEEAAAAAIWSLRQFATAGLLGASGYTMRWDEEQRGWVLWVLRDDRQLPSFVFDVPVRVPLFESEGVGWDRKTFARREALLLPRKGGPSMEFVALPTEREMDLSGARAMIAAGSGKTDMTLFIPVADWTEGEARASTLDCPSPAQCFRFDASLTDAMEKRVRENRDVYTAQFALLAKSTAGVETIGQLRREAGIENRPLYRPPLRDMFPQAEE